MAGNNETKPKPRLWVVTELYYPEETSTGHHMTKIAEGLTSDFAVGVICGQPNYSKRGITVPKHETRNDVKIFRVPGTRLDKNVILFRLINMLTLGTAVFFRAILSFRKTDQVLVVTTPPNLPYVCAFASLFRGSQYTLLIHDNYPQVLVAAGKAHPTSAIVRIWHFLNRWLFKYAAKIIVLGRDMKTLVERETKGLDVPVVSIPNWAELDLVKPTDRDRNPLLVELGLESKFVFLYAGNMGYTNDLESLARCAEMLPGDERIHFVFLGSGAKKSWLSDYIQNRYLKNVTILDPRPRNEQSEFLNACDVAVITMVEGMFGVSVPSRIYNAIAAGKPLLAITEPGSELARMIDEEQVGWWIPPGDKDALLNTVKAIAANKAQLRSMGARAREAAERKYSLDRALSEYRRELVKA
jgi:glycosyltransferase involved in cell wall biosynthesis